jgi:hypothetical protein
MVDLRWSPSLFRWVYLAVAVVFLSVLTWMVNDMRQELRQSRPPTVTLEGELVIPQGVQGTGVSYKIPFTSPPQLTFPEGLSGWTITDERTDSFYINKIGSDSQIRNKLKWKAEGRPAKTKLEQQNEAILQTLQRLEGQAAAHDASLRTQNEAILHELQLLRQQLRK